MTIAAASLAEITAKAIRLLCREIGPANTARFLSQFTTGFGNYTRERDHLIERSSVDDLIAEIEKGRRRQHKPRKPPRSTKA